MNGSSTHALRDILQGKGLVSLVNIVRDNLRADGVQRILLCYCSTVTVEAKLQIKR